MTSPAAQAPLALRHSLLAQLLPPLLPPLLPLLLPLFLSGCVGLPQLPVSPDRPTLAHGHVSPAPVSWDHPAYQLDGRFVLRYPNSTPGESQGAAQQASGRFVWEHQGDTDRLLLADPLGRGLAAIERHPAGARLTTGQGEVYEAADADQLLRRISDLPLPVNALADWLANRNPQGDYRETLPDGRPSRRHSQGWWIDYSYVDGTSTPRRITARWGEDIELRLAIESWQDTTDTPAND